MTDKHGVLARRDLRDAVIELGCGPRKRRPGSIAVDVIDGEHVDIVGDALDVLRALPAGCARLVSSSHFLEHLADAGPILDEMSRVLGAGGEIEIVVPHFTNPYFHSDPTHRNSLGFGLYTMSFGFCFSLGPWLGTLVLDRFGAPVLWTGAFALGALSAALFASLDEPKGRVS